MEGNSGTDDELVLSSFADGILTLTLNRPDRLNAWTRAMERRYFDVLDRADDDPDVRVIVVTGAGRGFCPGMDTETLALAARDQPSVPDPRSMTHGLGVRKPMIAAINGACAGIGLVQALVCDVRFVAEGAKLSTAFTRRGLPAEFACSWLLSRLVGQGVASDLLLSGRVVTADEALRLGLVNRIVPAETVVEAARSYAADLVAHCSPVAMAAVKRQLAADWDRSQEEALVASTGLTNDPAIKPDFSEGVLSYVERRPPRFRSLPPRGVPLEEWTEPDEPAGATGSQWFESANLLNS
jgi:enoyl-CoA hydratase/carnithine racemase